MQRDPDHALAQLKAPGGAMTGCKTRGFKSFSLLFSVNTGAQPRACIGHSQLGRTLTVAASREITKISRGAPPDEVFHDLVCRPRRDGELAGKYITA
jgi:hypothetical protein